MKSNKQYKRFKKRFIMRVKNELNKYGFYKLDEYLIYYCLHSASHTYWCYRRIKNKELIIRISNSIRFGIAELWRNKYIEHQEFLNSLHNLIKNDTQSDLFNGSRVFHLNTDRYYTEAIETNNAITNLSYDINVTECYPTEYHIL